MSPLETSAGQARRMPGGLGKLLSILPLAVLVILPAVFVDGFLREENLIAIIQASAAIGILAVGSAAITIVGKFVSLAVEQQTVVLAYVFAGCLVSGVPLAVTLLAVLGVALVIGFIQGMIVALGMNPIVATLAFGSLLFGGLVWVSDNRTITLLANPVADLGGGLTVGIPNQAIIFVLITLIGSWFYSRTTLGRQMVLTGSNPGAAALIGIPVARVIIAAYVISALASALVAILLVGQVSQAINNMFAGYTIDVAAAVLVGGIAIQGGSGQLWRAGLGAVVLTLLSNVMLLLGLDDGLRLVLKGLLAATMLIAMSLWRKERAA